MKKLFVVLAISFALLFADTYTICDNPDMFIGMKKCVSADTIMEMIEDTKLKVQKLDEAVKKGDSDFKNELKKDVKNSESSAKEAKKDKDKIDELKKEVEKLKDETDKLKKDNAQMRKEIDKLKKR